MGYGHRAALLPAINLSQLSEFSLVIASLGLALGHIDYQLVSLLIMIFVITSTSSTYMIQFSHRLSQLLGRMHTRLRVHDIDIQEARSEGRPNHTTKRVVFLGFFREVSSVLCELERLSDDGRPALLEKVLVIDFNPEVHAELRRRGIHCI
jgi:Kef-type K+ transport system membrane component KefB